jgi:hypothetical protein
VLGIEGRAQRLQHVEALVELLELGQLLRRIDGGAHRLEFGEAGVEELLHRVDVLGDGLHRSVRRRQSPQLHAEHRDLLADSLHATLVVEVRNAIALEVVVGALDLVVERLQLTRVDLAGHAGGRPGGRVSLRGRVALGRVARLLGAGLALGLGGDLRDQGVVAFGGVLPVDGVFLVGRVEALGGEAERVQIAIGRRHIARLEAGLERFVLLDALQRRSDELVLRGQRRAQEGD